MGPIWSVACKGFLQVLASSRQRTKVEPRRPKGTVGEDSERRIMGLLRQA
jgi:hypothetical protein